MDPREVRQLAKKAWFVADLQAKEAEAPTSQHPDYGQGRIVTGTVANYIRRAHTLDRGGKPDPDVVDTIRAYLRLSGNIVVLERLADFSFRIFVRAEFNAVAPAGEVVTVAQADHRSQRAKPRSRRPEAPPTKRWPGWTDAQLDAARALLPRRHKFDALRADLVAALVSAGGELHDRSGQLRSQLSGELREQDRMAFSRAADSLEGAGVLVRETSQSRTYRLALTPTGWQIAAALGLDVADQPGAPATLPAERLAAASRDVDGVDLGPLHAQILGSIAARGGTYTAPSPADLATYLAAHTTTGAAGQIAAALTELGAGGLVEPQADNDHVTVSLTPAGWRCAAALFAPFGGHSPALPPAHDDGEPSGTEPDVAPAETVAARSATDQGGALQRLRSSIDAIESALQETGRHAGQRDRDLATLDAVRDVLEAHGRGETTPLRALGSIEAALNDARTN